MTPNHLSSHTIRIDVFENERKKKMPDTPERIYNVSKSQLSIARHYGGIKFNGAYYTYFPEEDMLVREDVLKKDKKQQAAQRRTERMRRVAQQEQAAKRAQEQSGKLYDDTIFEGPKDA
jgi:hypothetical protein